MPENLIDPIWEYDHSLGRSITGGYVYEGQETPGLADYYLYGDFVSGKIWPWESTPMKGWKTTTYWRQICRSLPSVWMLKERCMLLILRAKFTSWSKRMNEN